MKKIFFTIAVGFWGFLSANTQTIAPEVISTSGEHFQGTNATLSWTLGEPVTETSVGNNAVLTQGFHQGNYTVVSVYDNPASKINVSVYPNPVVDIMFINIDNSGESVNISLTDMNGKSLMSRKSKDSKTQINMMQFPSSNYLLTIRKENGDVLKTFKVVKSDNF